jgi:hypothetical protein
MAGGGESVAEASRLQLVTLFDELMALVAALDDANVEYALVGGLAVAVWGAPRATRDIDLLVRPESLVRALEVVKGHGFDHRAQLMTFRDGMTLQRVSRAEGRELLTVDFILVNENLEPIWGSRQKLESISGPIWVISRDALIQMKAFAARPQDLADIERLRDIDR